MTRTRPSEIDPELDRLQAELERCGRDRQAHEARVQAIKLQMTAARVKGLLEERAFQQREWRLLFWYDGAYRLQAYPHSDTWNQIDDLVGAEGNSRRFPIPLPGGIMATFRLVGDGEYVFEVPDADQVIGVVQALGLTVVGLGVLDDDIQAKQTALDQKRAALARFRQAFGEQGE
ncbi:MAG: hypothetical protein WC343_03125 [Bacilli bacterium]